MKVLVATETDAQFRYYQGLLAAGEFDLQHAPDGPETLRLAASTRPDLVLIDFDQPGINSFEIAVRLKAAEHSVFTPVMFVTDCLENDALARCYVAGADDVIAKPVDPTLLAAKIRARQRTREVSERVQRDRDELNDYRRIREREDRIAARLLENARDQSADDLPSVRTFLAPLGGFSGDLVLTEISPRGSLYLLVADCTGHGLPASIATLPISRVFFTMARKGLNIGDMATELNRNLRMVLSDDMFVAATVVELNQPGTRMTAWCGGLPDGLVVGIDGTLRNRLRSQHMPLGVEDDTDFDRTVQVFEVSEGDRIYLYTDGILEPPPPATEPVPESAFEKLVGDAIRAHPDGDACFRAILGDLEKIQAGGETTDDRTLVEITAAPLEAAPHATLPADLEGMLPWQLEFRLGPTQLRLADPVNQVVAMLGESPCLADHKDVAFTVLSEMYTNALDHGLLGLDSAMKEDEDGFIEYYQAKAERLDTLQEGTIEIRVAFTPAARGGRLDFGILDSGSGFDYAAALQREMDDDAAHGRGLTLIRTFADRVEYADGGRRMEVSMPLVF